MILPRYEVQIDARRHILIRCHGAAVDSVQDLTMDYPGQENETLLATALETVRLLNIETAESFDAFGRGPQD
jgi:hypothetical protein